MAVDMKKITPSKTLITHGRTEDLIDILEIEKVQKRATKLVISLKKACYSDRLKSLNLPTLKYRRLRGDAR